MSVVAVIPARGGSKGIPGKNLRLIGGSPLIRRAVTACESIALIDSTWVTTDDVEIATEARAAGARIVDRPAEIAGDTASSESALLHALDVIADEDCRPDVVVFVQCTSPFIDVDALERAIVRVVSGSADVVFSAVETFEFLWRLGDDGAEGVNHDHSFRPRRQDREPHFRETGAFYVMRAEGFRAAGFRFFGRVEVEPVAPVTGIEIDEPTDLAVADAIASAIEPSPRLPSGVDLAAVRALVMDFDGVHTDDRVYVDQEGHEMVVANRSDGHGIKLLRELGYELLILSTERNEVVARRADKLRIECRHGIDDKLPELDAWRRERGLAWSEIAYIGNDVNDLGCLAAVGLPVAVADAQPEVLRAVSLVTGRCGGAGAVRELADTLIRHRRPAPADTEETST